MGEGSLKQAILESIKRTVDRLPFITSATVAGSFPRAGRLEGVSDIDTIVIVDRLDQSRFTSMCDSFRADLGGVLRNYEFDLIINATLGPLKFNKDRTAVLHLMPYSAEAHRDHVINSPFTCLDWQRSPLWHKASLGQVYPVFGLQPHHFISARRGTKDYLSDFVNRQISYRELNFDGGYHEVKRQQPMSCRDRHEFGYHILRFLMQNFLKLVRRSNETSEGDTLCREYFAEFPDGAEVFTPFFLELRERKQKGDFATEIADLDRNVIGFVETFERQFRAVFERDAVRHVVFRHGPTQHNKGEGEATVLQGDTDTPLADDVHTDLGPLREVIRRIDPRRVLSSPLQRNRGSVRLLELGEPQIDERLREIGYGVCEGRTVAEARRMFPDLFAAWGRGEDPCFPGGSENTAAVLERVRAFSGDHWQPGKPASAVCTHNVVLRCLVGDLLNVPRRAWHRLTIPHLAPIELVATRYGLFVDLNDAVERKIFGNFFQPES